MLLFHFLKYAYINRYNLSLSKKQVKQLQQKRFTKLVHYVAKHSLYYQKLIKEHKIDINDCIPEDFPILTKAQLIEEFDNIVTDKKVTKAKITKFLEHSHDPQELFLNKYYIIHTSGSSGTISYYVYTEKEFAQGIAPSIRIAGTKPFQKLAYIAASKGHFAGITMINAAKKIPFLYSSVQTFDINSPFTTIIAKLNTMQPTIISGYAFALRELAKAQKEGKLHIRPKILQSGGEPLSQEDKIYIQTVFKVEVMNVYASSEHLLTGIGKGNFQGMYLMEDNLIFEIHAKHTNITNLYNYTLPLIRYQMSDWLLPITDETKHMPFTKIENIVGRNEHVPIFLNDKGEEDFISPHIIGEFYVKHLTKFQLHLLNKKNFIFKISLEKNISEKEKTQVVKAIEKNLKGILQEKLMTQVKFKIEIVDNLWVDRKTGKFKLITK